MSEEYRVKFICPDCEAEAVEERLTDVVQFSEITDIARLGDGECAVDYGNVSLDGGSVMQYACCKCGYILRDADGHTICDDRNLLEWLKLHGMLEEN